MILIISEHPYRNASPPKEDVFGAEKAGFLYSQYPFYDIYQDSRYANFLLEDGGRRIAIEIDDDASHLPGLYPSRSMRMT